MCVCVCVCVCVGSPEAEQQPADGPAAGLQHHPARGAAFLYIYIYLNLYLYIYIYIYVCVYVYVNVYQHRPELRGLVSFDPSPRRDPDLIRVSLHSIRVSFHSIRDRAEILAGGVNSRGSTGGRRQERGLRLNLTMNIFFDNRYVIQRAYARCDVHMDPLTPGAGEAAVPALDRPLQPISKFLILK